MSSEGNVPRRLSRILGSSSPPFKRLKSRLAKFKEKRKALPHDSTPCDSIKESAAHEPTIPSLDTASTPSLATASTVQGNDPSQNTGPCDSGAHETSEDAQTLSTTVLARRIHSLLSPFPSPYTLSPSGSLLPPPTSDSANADSTFFSLLSSVSAMNGSISKGRESVWAALERLRYLPHPRGERREPAEDDEPDMSSVMICGPLQPTEDTEVEIARSEVVSIEATDDEPAPAEQGVGGFEWLFRKGKWRAEPVSPTEPPIAKEVRVWYPSRTKVSLQAFWWGYRIYLPPPVMRVLSDKSLEAAKRAAMITAALTWLVSHLPTTMLPPQMKPVLAVIKQIVPVMSYAGGFIAWSWKTVQGFDKGQGVTLSATWLLPIALVPGTWFYTEPPSSGEFSRS